STAVTGLLRYKMPSNFSVYGGLRAESVTGEVSIPVFGGYTMSTARDTQVGYVVGASWEKPEIAARVALTYNSAITHTLDSTEFGAIPGQFDTTVPQSVNLEFQTGIAKDTLLFGSVRWVDWSEFDITPTTFTTAVVPGESLVDYDEDTITYNLGIGRRFNENWSGAITVGYEAAGGGTVGNLGPTDGFTSVGVGATYTKGNMKITGGVRYVEIGDALTVIGPSNGVFSGNSAIGAGVKIGFTF
ncbi:MAG: hypothetical protein RLZZ528_614, partial [Pseudomonadota bacterium]